MRTVRKQQRLQSHNSVLFKRTESDRIRLTSWVNGSSIQGTIPIGLLRNYKYVKVVFGSGTSSASFKITGTPQSANVWISLGNFADNDIIDVGFVGNAGAHTYIYISKTNT